MNYPIMVMIMGMALVTYLPRMLPSVVMDKATISPKVEKFLRMIPYTAMAALIFPGIVNVDRARPEIGMIGGVAGLLAWRKCPVIICVIAAIGVDIFLYCTIR